MRTQFAITPALPEWAEGLPAEIVTTVRQEAIRRNMKPKDLVKEWTVRAAKDLTAQPQEVTTP